MDACSPGEIYQRWSLVARAISLASQAHQGQLRKDGRTPYVSHAVRVGWLLEHLFGIRDAEVLAAGVLHDVIEDTTVDYDDLQQQFGPRVADLVARLSKDKRLPEPERERQYHEQLLHGGEHVLAIKLADLLENLADVASLPLPKRTQAVAKFQATFRALAPQAQKLWPEIAELILNRLHEVAC